MPASTVTHSPVRHQRPMVRNAEFKYPSRRAYVIKVRSDANTAAERVRAARAGEVISRLRLFPSIK